MNTRAAAVLFTIPLVLAGCPSKEGERQDAQTSSGTTNGGPPATGPLANLEAAPFANEVWIDNEGGAQIPVVYYTQQNVRVSAQCRQATGQLSCDAIRQLRNAPPVDVPRRELSGSISAGTRVCLKLGHKLVQGHNSMGAEDGFCRFPDGSLVSTGALEQYAFRVME